MDVETGFCKMCEHFQAILTKLEKAAGENTPIHEVEQELVEELRTLGRSAVEAFIERQGDGDVGETVEHEGHTLKRLPEMLSDRYFSAFGPVWIEQCGYATRRTQKVELKPLLCFQYKDLVGFPRSYEENFRYIYVILDGRVAALAEIPTEKADATAKAAPVKGVKPYRFDFSKKRSGFIDKPLDLGLAVITSKDGARAVILYAPVGKSVLSNLHIPCLHADPHFDHIKPAETKERIVNVIFAGADWRGVVERITKQHAQGVSEQTDLKSIEGEVSPCGP